MFLYHATTQKRAEQILKNRCIKKNIERFFTIDNNGDGYSTQGYVYLSNEITFALSFAISHNLSEKSNYLYIFKIGILDKLIEADYDELRHQVASKTEIDRYGGELQCSLLEYKSCRVAVDIDFSNYSIEYVVVENEKNISDLIDNAGYNYKYVTENYTKKQRNFIQNLDWKKV